MLVGVVVGDSPCIVTEEALCHRLLCESTVQVRRCEIISRWRESCDLSVLISQRDSDWHETNVLGNDLVVSHFLDGMRSCCCWLWEAERMWMFDTILRSQFCSMFKL